MKTGKNTEKTLGFTGVFPLLTGLKLLNLNFSARLFQFS
jgi:hypothetical protein